MRRMLPLAPLFLLGCVGETASRSLTPGKPGENQISDATRALAARVDQLGAELVMQNPFLGVSPTFMVVGKPGREIGHPDLNGVLVSEGLAAQLSDDELAGVLALELARMSVEARRAREFAREQPLPTLPSGGKFDPTQTMTQALVNEQIRKETGKRPAESPHDVAKRILESSGRSADGLARAESTHAEASRTRNGPGELGDRPAPPRWTN